MKVIKFLVFSLVFSLVSGLIYYSFDAGRNYSDRVSKEIYKNIESMKIDVNENNKEVYCNNLIISKSNGWSVYNNNINDYFIREDKYIDIKECVDINLLKKVPLVKF